MSCGGCDGLGAHGRHCPERFGWHPWQALAEQAEEIGDTIGGNAPELANLAYRLAAAIRGEVVA